MIDQKTIEHFLVGPSLGGANIDQGVLAHFMGSDAARIGGMSANSGSCGCEGCSDGQATATGRDRSRSARDFGRNTAVVAENVPPTPAFAEWGEFVPSYAMGTVTGDGPQGYYPDKANCGGGCTPGVMNDMEDRCHNEQGSCGILSCVMVWDSDTNKCVGQADCSPMQCPGDIPEDSWPGMP